MEFESELLLEETFVKIYKKMNKSAQVNRQHKITNGIVDVRVMKNNKEKFFECKLADINKGISQALKYMNFLKDVSLVIPYSKRSVISKYKSNLSLLNIKVYLVRLNSYKIIEY